MREAFVATGADMELQYCIRTGPGGRLTQVDGNAGRIAERDDGSFQ